ncbi:MAG: inositol monophosphatase family protein [Elusimicrobia bacterium]|nr:inositol monophosphatase family protein [Elusimicrobiota bacterium]
MPKFNKYTQTAVKAAIAGGKILLKYYNKPLTVNFKGKFDPVTIADKLSQKVIIENVKRDFPNHSFLAEEDNNLSCDMENCWVIDPLDGTVNFIHKIPLFCVSIAYKYKNKIISGVIHCPVLKETFIAEKNKGAYLNGKKISVSCVNNLARSLVVTGFPYDRSRLKRVIKNLGNILGETQGIRRLGSAAMDLAYVACGRFEAFWEEGLNPWDSAAGALIVEEAGGKVTDYNGEKCFEKKRHILATNGLVHKKMLKYVSIKQG